MLLVLSPAKTLKFDVPVVTDKYSQPDFMARSAELIDMLKNYSPAQIASLMHLSDPLAQLNSARYAAWRPDFTPDNARQAVFTFNGDVYAGLAAATLKPKQLEYAQQHIRILSGLYGLLRPLDLMQAYRLEMGTKLPNRCGKDLYAFWGNTVTEALKELLKAQQARALVNLASEEYFKVIKPALLDVPVITPVFEDWKNGQYKVISFYAKRARGLMARYAAVKGIKKVEALKKFDVDGYAYEEEVSTTHTWVFRRRQEK